MYKILFSKLSKLATIPLLVATLTLGTLYYFKSGALDKTETTLKNVKSVNETLTFDNKTLMNLLEIEKSNYLISQENVAALKLKISNPVVKKEVVYVEKYIAKPSVDKCVVSDDWLRAYEGIRHNPYSNVSADKD